MENGITGLCIGSAVILDMPLGTCPNPMKFEANVAQG